MVLEDRRQDWISEQLRWSIAQVGFQGTESCVCGGKHCRGTITASIPGAAAMMVG